MNSLGLKGASGLGDTIYAYPIAKYYSKKYDIVRVMSNYPEILEKIDNVKVYPYQKLNYIKDEDGEKHPVDIRFTYCGKKYTPGSSQFEDSVEIAGIREKIELSIDWTISDDVKRKGLVNLIKDRANGRKICVLAAPYEPFGRDDQWGALLRIEPDIMQHIANEFHKEVFFVQIGNKYTLHKIKDHGIDLVNNTTVSELLDIVSISDIGLSQIGNLLPICESLNKKNVIIYSKKALDSENRFIASIRPEKVTHYKHLNTSIIDNEKNYLEKFNDAIHKGSDIQ